VQCSQTSGACFAYLDLGVAVDEDLASDDALRLAARKDVHQGRLPRARAAHQRGQHAGLRIACARQKTGSATSTPSIPRSVARVMLYNAM
jgi:hypothetical protein